MKNIEAGLQTMNAALDSCAKCHNDANKDQYNGKSVHTVHGGTSLSGNESDMVWKGLDARNWKRSLK